MQFETKIVNGKPSIFFANDTSKANISKKINTKDKRATKAIRDSYEISGEVDQVKKSPRNVQKNSVEVQTKSANNKKSSSSNNGLTLKPDQLMSLLSAIQTNGAQIKIDDDGKIKLIEDKQQKRSKNDRKSNSDDELKVKSNDYNENGYESDISPRMGIKNRKSNNKKVVDRLNFDNEDEEDVTTIRKPKIVTAYESDEERRADEAKKPIKQQQMNLNENLGASSLIEKKRLKWQADKQARDQLQQQEIFDRQKFNQIPTNNPKIQDSRASVIPRTGHTPEPPKADSLTLGQKKRLQWQKEKEELNNSYRQNKSRFRSYYDEFNLRSSREEISGGGGGSNSIMKSFSLNNLTQNDQINYSNENEQILSKLNIIDQDHKLSLIERKKLKWANDTNDAQNAYNPFGRPGAGAPNQRIIEQQESSNKRTSYETMQKELLKKQIELLEAQSASTAIHDQTKVPAAMRTSVLFGDVLFDDDVKRTKELERKKWLLELEAQKKEKLMEKEYNREKDKLNDLKKDLEIKQQNYYENEASDRSKTKSIIPQQQPEQQPDQQKSFQRSLNRLLDPSQLDEIDRKRKANLIHQREIQAQIEEKKRLQKLEDELQQLDNQKIENDLKQMNLNQQQEVQKRKQHYFGVNMNPSSTAGDDNHQQMTTKTPLNHNNDEQSTTVVDSAQLQLLQAEYNASLEKHKRLLVKLQKGGHDTQKLESKFNEFRSKCRVMGVNVGTDVPTNQKPSKSDKHEIPTSKTQARQMYDKQLQQQNLELNDRKSKLRDELMDDSSTTTKEQADEKKLKQLFNLLREDTNDMPIEMTEENVKMLLKKVAKNQDIENKKLQNKNSTKKFEKPQKSASTTTAAAIEQPKKKVQIGDRPKWGYKNPENKKPVPNTQKDPFFKERQMLAEERRKLQIEQLKSLIELNNQRSSKMHSNRAKSTSDIGGDDDDDINDIDIDTRVISKPATTTTSNNRMRSRNSNNGPKQESIMNLLNNHNLRNKPIYEEQSYDDDGGDDGGYGDHRRVSKTNTQRRLKSQNTRNIDFDASGKNSNMGFVPFLRTDEFLDPAHATSPVPPSRESTATKRDRDRARQAYFKNMKPSNYGSTNDNYHENTLDVDYKTKMKDPLFNKNLVTGRPTPRQETILSQLANLKQTLMQKQKEVASSIRYDDDNNDDDDLNN